MDLEFHQLDLRYEDLRARRPQQESRLLACLDAHGQQVPIVVVETEPARRYLVLDGYKRLRALRRLGRDTVQAVVLDLAESEALVLQRSLEMAPGPSALEQGWLLRELHQSFGLSLAELARRFGHSPSWASRRLALAQDLPGSVQEHIRSGRIPAQAAMRALVPLARQSPEACEQLADAIARLALRSHQIQKLYSAWLRSEPSVRKRILEDPLVFLRAQEEQKSPRVEPSPLQALRRDLERLDLLARRCLKQGSEVASKLPDTERDAIQRSLRQAGRELERLADSLVSESTPTNPATAAAPKPSESSLSEEARHAEPTDTDRDPGA